MHDSQPNNDLVACTTAVEAATIVFALVKRVPAPFKSLADQIVRASSSVAANLSEGNGRFGRDRFNHWRIAYGSAKEVDTSLRSRPDGEIEGCHGVAEGEAGVIDTRHPRGRKLRPGSRFKCHRTSSTKSEQ